MGPLAQPIVTSKDLLQRGQFLKLSFIIIKIAEATFSSSSCPKICMQCEHVTTFIRFAPLLP